MKNKDWTPKGTGCLPPDKLMKTTKIAATLVALLLILSTPAFAESSNFSQADRQHLKGLLKDQFSQSYLNRVFKDSRLKRLNVIPQRNVHNGESKRDYQDFQSPYSIHLAKKFQRKWRTTLKRASKQFDVPSEALVAIILVETGFGNVMGRYPVIGVFSSIVIERVEQAARYPIDPNASEEDRYYLTKLDRKAKWATVELAALLKLSQDNKRSPYKYKGSYAGAFGLPQFLPSSYLKWGYDSDANGTVNLYWVPDALYSTANYLKEHGWQGHIGSKASQEAVFGYNHSTPYVEAVLAIAKRLQKGKKKRTQAVALADPQRRLSQPNSGSKGKKITDRL